MVFAGLKKRFCSPTSYTLSLDIAAGFARQSQYGDGIVIAIRNDRMGSPFFHCISWSRFPWKYEVVFVGGCRRMEISGLATISDGRECDEWVQSIQMFQTVMIDGSRLTQKIRKQNQIMMNELVSAAVQDRNTDDLKEVSSYAFALFEYIQHEINVMSINTGYVSNECLYGDKFAVIHLHFNKDSTIEWDINPNYINPS